VQMTRRITLAEVEIGGKTIEKGSFCALILASANHDDEHFGEGAERLDVARESAHQHLSFGGGAHYCLGAALARLEGEVAIGSLIRRFPALDFAGDPT
jgi:cytochrome P450